MSKKQFVVPVDVAKAIGFSRSDFAKLPAGTKMFYAKLVYSEQIKSNKIIPFKRKRR